MKNNVVIHTERQTYISLYTGGGGLDLGFRLANPDAVPLLYVERDMEAAALLVDHIKAGLIHEAPVWSDTGTFDCKPFAGKVDFLVAGFPCQPWSNAGKRKKTDDERWLWPHIERIIREVRCRRLFLENVPGLVRGGLELVLAGLAKNGFDAEWASIKASDVGATHRRERVFILAHSNNGLSSKPVEEVRSGGPAPVEGGRRMAHPVDTGVSPSRHGDKRKGSAGTEEGEDGSQPQPGGSDKYMGNAEGQRMEGSRASGVGFSRTHAETALSDCTDRGFPPAPDDREAWREVLRHRPDLAPATATAQHEVRRVADGLARGLGRTAQLKILGNGVVPAQAATAFWILQEKLQ